MGIGAGAARKGGGLSPKASAISGRDSRVPGGNANETVRAQRLIDAG